MRAARDAINAATGAAAAPAAYVGRSCEIALVEVVQ